MAPPWRKKVIVVYLFFRNVALASIFFYYEYLLNTWLEIYWSSIACKFVMSVDGCRQEHPPILSKTTPPETNDESRPYNSSRHSSTIRSRVKRLRKARRHTFAQSKQLHHGNTNLWRFTQAGILNKILRPTDNR